MNVSSTAWNPLWLALFFAWSLAGCALSVAPTSSEGRQISLELNAYPARVSATDSTATAEIWATIRKGNKPVADSTLVVFASTAGNITPSSITRDGLAIAILQSGGDGRLQRVQVVAQALSVRDTLEVDFVILE